MGTSRYRCRDQRLDEYDFGVDFYGLGTTLTYSLTGKTPRTSSATQWKKKLRQWFSEYDPEFRDDIVYQTILTCLMANPRKRFGYPGVHQELVKYWIEESDLQYARMYKKSSMPDEPEDPKGLFNSLEDLLIVATLKSCQLEDAEPVTESAQKMFRRIYSVMPMDSIGPFLGAIILLVLKFYETDIPDPYDIVRALAGSFKVSTADILLMEPRVFQAANFTIE